MHWFDIIRHAAVLPSAVKSRPPPPAPKPRKLASSGNTELTNTTSDKPNSFQTAASKSASNSPARFGLSYAVIVFFVVYYGIFQLP